ncbi:MAG: right-handed parallel beta-helix repeat-containing protein [Propionibacteriaceae bacterium]|jgi:hypothetical protein|nr:right-handed parallel beta-helix repeat-containing protein [Propionibacteriaceae bacterium]
MRKFEIGATAALVGLLAAGLVPISQAWGETEATATPTVTVTVTVTAGASPTATVTPTAAATATPQASPTATGTATGETTETTEPVDALTAAAAYFGISDYTVVEVKAKSELSAQVAQAVKQRKTLTPLVVHLAAGSYKLTAPLRLAQPSVYVVAEDGATVTWKGKGAAMINIASLSGAGVYQGDWDGSGGDVPLVMLKDATGVKLAKLSLSDVKKYGILVTDASELTTDEVKLSKTGLQGLIVSKGSKATLGKTTVSGAKGNGASVFDKGSTLTLNDSTISAPKGYGVAFSKKATGVLDHSTVKNSGQEGLTANASTLTLKSKNTVSGSKKTGIIVSNGSKFKVTGSGNVVTKNKNHGLFFQNKGTTATISKSVKITKNSWYGLQSQTGAKVTMVKCKLSGNVRGDAPRTLAGGTITIKK